MRHSRRAVMTERYKIYMRKHIFNGKYFVRNLQIAFCAIVAIVLVVGLTAVAVTSKDDEKEQNTSAVVASADVSVKEALFGKTEEEHTIVKEKEKKASTEKANNTEEVVITEDTVAVVASTEKVFAELSTVISATVAEVTEEELEKSSFDGRCIANVEETLNIRKEPNAEAEFVGQMNRGAIATIEGTDGDWTQIKSGEVEGYVLTEFILTGKDAEEFAVDYVTLLGTVLEDGVNVREEQSKDAEVLTVLNENDTISVLEKPETEENMEEDAEAVVAASTSLEDESVIDAQPTEKTSEEATTEKASEEETTEKASEQPATEEEASVEEKETEEITWIPVMLEDGKTGYVSAEFMVVDELYELAVSAEELQRRAEEEAARIAAEEEAKRKAAAEAAAAEEKKNNSSNNNNNYQGAVTDPITTTESGDLIGSFTITAYCGCSACCGASGGKTASGTTPTEGRTIAADTSILPFGSQVVINGVVYTVEDSGSGVRGNHIDIFFATHDRALAFGRQTINVYKY